MTGNAFAYSLPAKSVTTLVLDFPSTSVRERAQASLHVSRTPAGFRVGLPSTESGRAQLVGLDGRVVVSRDFPSGTTLLDLPAPGTAGIFEARVVQGDRVSMSKIVINR